MADISIFIQGPLNNVSLSGIPYYQTIGPVIINYWTNDKNEHLLDQYDLEECVIVKSPQPSYKLFGNPCNDTTTWQFVSIERALRNVTTKYVIRTRSDESWGNLQPIVDKFNNNKLKIVCGNIFFKKWIVPYHIGDHLFIGDKNILLKAYHDILLNPNIYKTGFPEQIAARAIMKAFLNKPINVESKEDFKEVFDIIDINLLQPFTAAYQHAKKIYYNEFEFNGIIKSINEI